MIYVKIEIYLKIIFWGERSQTKYRYYVIIHMNSRKYKLNYNNRSVAALGQKGWGGRDQRIAGKD